MRCPAGQPLLGSAWPHPATIHHEEISMTTSQPDLEMQVQVDILNRYKGCMEEVKRRTLVIDGFVQRELHTPYFITTVESVCLQIRKVLELIALASLVANKAEYEKYRKAFRTDWHAKRILKTLEKVNPNFYPYPSRQVIDPETDKVVEAITITTGYLTRAEFEVLYDKCGGILHAHNPFSESQQEIREFWDGVQEWVNKIIVLLNHHHVQLVDERYQLWTVMKSKNDGDVHVSVFERQDSSGDA